MYPTTALSFENFGTNKLDDAYGSQYNSYFFTITAFYTKYQSLFQNACYTTARIYILSEICTKRPRVASEHYKDHQCGPIWHITTLSPY